MKTKNFRKTPRVLVNLSVVLALSTLTAAGIAVAQSAPTAPAQKTLTQTLPQDSTVKEKLTDSTFVEKAAAGSLAEIEISKLAATKSTNVKIKKFAAQMVKDHEAAGAKLKQIATTNRLDIPTKTDAAHKKLIDELQGLSEPQFDQSYVDLMKKDHDTTVALFDNAAGEPTLNAELRVFANQSLPTLRAHQKHAHALTETGDKKASR
ncbi:MAG: outer membrane protein [Verrucomicrobiaceae bacterium]|nr:outer membrane protein [Verrucomicrobiaceae bacterium]